MHIKSDRYTEIKIGYSVCWAIYTNNNNNNNNKKKTKKKTAGVAVRGGAPSNGGVAPAAKGVAGEGDGGIY